MATKINLFADKMNEKDFYMTRAQLNKVIEWMPPSVTKIINSVKTKREIDALKKLFKDPNSAMSKATAKGRNFHKALETGVIVDTFTEKVVSLFKKDILVDIDEVWAQEKSIYHKDHFYYGKFDGIGVYKGKVTLFDYKKTNKAKKNNSSMRNYLIQLCAYKKAHESMYPDIQIEQVAIFNLFGKTESELGTNVKILNDTEVEQHTNLFYGHLFDFQMNLKGA